MGSSERYKPRRPASGAHVDSAVRFGRRLRAARVEAGLSQRQLASGVLGCSYAYISRIEAGMRVPSMQVIDRLAERLDVASRWLAREEGPRRTLTVAVDRDAVNVRINTWTPGAGLGDLSTEEHAMLERDLHRAAVEAAASAAFAILARRHANGKEDL